MMRILIAGAFLMATSLSVFAADAKTALDNNWICTTNASSSSVDADTKADDEMAKTAKSASDAFAFAASHCRDCTKITCETK